VTKRGTNPQRIRPQPSDYPEALADYVERVPESDVLSVLASQPADLRQIAASLSRERERHAYAPGKWTVRQIVGHLGDGERIFGYRALCFSRGDRTPLPGFDENAYVERSRSNDVPLRDLVEEFASLRAANLRLFQALDEEGWRETGEANGTPISVRALAFAMAGHVRHHVAVLHERYGIGPAK
jgi:hypothetical protein